MYTSKEKRLMKKATKAYHGIDVCGTAGSHKDNFTITDGQLTFWFNDKNGSTHMMTEETQSKESSDDYSQVFKYATAHVGELIEDIQQLLQHACIFKCTKCKYRHLCLRKEKENV